MMSSVTLYTQSPEETQRLAYQIGKQVRPGDFFAYFGDLGTGKTTFTRGLALGMGLPDVVCSPTYALVQEYHGDGLSLYHFDLYRIADETELESTGFYDYPLESSVFAVEWAEHMEEELPENAIRIYFQYVDDHTRALTIQGGERFVHLGDGYVR